MLIKSLPKSDLKLLTDGIEDSSKTALIKQLRPLLYTCLDRRKMYHRK